MKRLTLLVATALVAVMLVAPAAFAQQTNGATDGQTAPMTGPQTAPMTGPQTAPMTGPQTAPMTGPQTAGAGAAGLPESGGPAILLPAAALLLGSGILTYAVLRRR